MEGVNYALSVGIVWQAIREKSYQMTSIIFYGLIMQSRDTLFLCLVDYGRLPENSKYVTNMGD